MAPIILRGKKNFIFEWLLLKCYLLRDCLAAPGTTLNENIPTGPAAANVNKNKTCYKCQQEGHVCFQSLVLSPSPLTMLDFQIARECPEVAEFVS